MDKLINHIARERRKLGLTQAALAERVGMSRKTINTVENGLFVPSAILALKLAKVFATPVEQIFELPDQNA